MPLNTPYEIAEAAALELPRINQRLVAIAHELAALQPKRDGALTLSLYPCGPGCLGCPHPRWRLWRYHPDKTRKFLGHVVDHPLKRLRKTREFSAVYNASHELIQEANLLLARKARLVKGLNALRRTLVT